MRFLALTLSLFLAIAFTACEKDNLTTSVSTEINLFGELAPATISAYGQLTDDAGNPVANARVQAGGVSTTTDIQGLWRLENAKVKATFGYITFESEKHLHGSRTIYAREGSLYEVNVELLRRDQTFTVDAAAGGTVQLPGSTATVAFGPGAFAKTDGAPITNGSVEVIAHYLDPNDSRTYDRMPGDLRGVSLNAEGNPGRDLSLLTSYGMIAVELITSGGASAKLAVGQTATLTMPLTGPAASKAPGSIPMWYFDEPTGVWVEEGMATRQGNSYVGTVSHFTFWNCDVANELVELCGSVGFEGTGTESVRTTSLQVRLRSERFGSRNALVDSRGEFCGGVPKGEAFILEVLGACGETVFTERIGPFTEDTRLGFIIIPKSDAQLVHVTGLATCNGIAITEGAARVTPKQGRAVVTQVNADGNFSVDVILCGEREITVETISYSNASSSTPRVITADGDVDAGPIDACATELSEFIRFSVDGELVRFTDRVVAYEREGKRWVTTFGDSTELDRFYFAAIMTPDPLFQTSSYTLGQGASIVYAEDNMPNQEYLLDGVDVELIITGNPKRVICTIPPTEVTVNDGLGGTVKRTIEAQLVFIEK